MTSIYLTIREKLTHGLPDLLDVKIVIVSSSKSGTRTPFIENLITFGELPNIIAS